MFGYFFLHHLEAPPANLTPIELTPPLKALLELRQDRKNIVLLIVDAPFGMALDQLLNFLLDDCKLQGEVVLPHQHFYDFAEAQAGPQDVVDRRDELDGPGEGADVADFGRFRDGLDLSPAGSQVLEVEFHHNRVDLDELVDCLPVDLLEKSGKQHAIYPELVAVDRTLDALQNLLVLRLAAKGPLDLYCIGLPV